MRRSLFVVLMLVLMLQAFWSAAAQVCRHEPVTVEAHFGHHVHLDVHTDADLDVPDAAGPAQADGAPQLPHLDCVGCHGGLCAALPACPAALPVAALAQGHATPYQRSITHGLPERLIRPPHHSLA